MRMQMHAESTCAQMKLEPLLHLIILRQQGCACATTPPLIVSVPGPLPLLTLLKYRDASWIEAHADVRADVDLLSAIIVIFLYAPTVMSERGPDYLGCHACGHVAICACWFCSSCLGPCVDF